MRARSLATAVLLVACSRPVKGLRTDAVTVRLSAHDTSWDSTVTSGEASLAAGHEVHVPLGADVQIALASREFVSIFSFPELGLRDFAAPGLPSSLKFHAGKQGTFTVEGDELCGRPHTDAKGVIIVEDERAFRAWAEGHR